MNATNNLWTESTGVLRRWRESLTAFFANRGFYRSRTHRVVGGVCGGLAARLNLPVSLVRAAFVILFFTGIVHALLLYVLLMVLLPDEPLSA